MQRDDNAKNDHHEQEELGEEEARESTKFARHEEDSQARSAGGPRLVKGEDAAVEGLDRRRGPGRRLSESLKAAEEGQLTSEQFLFVMAINSFKQANKVHYPAWTDVLEVIRLLGYRKTQESELKLRNAVDWTEEASAPTGVRPERWMAWGKIDKSRKAA